MLEKKFPCITNPPKNSKREKEKTICGLYEAISYHRLNDQVLCKMTNLYFEDDGLLASKPYIASKPKKSCQGVWLGQVPNPCLQCFHWLGHLLSLARPTPFAHSQGLI